MDSCTRVWTEDDKIFHAAAVPVHFSKYVLHQANDVLGHNDTARTF